MKKETLININEDSTKSDYQRQAAHCLQETKHRNHKINKFAAIGRLINSTSLGRDEAVEYVEMVISDAENMEWEG